MRYILCDANIFATNIRYMNDSEEYANGLKELRKIYENHSEGIRIPLEKITEELEKDIPIYSISFSAARDLLSQWSMYAGESGVSIKMQFEENERYKVFAVGETERQFLVDEDVSIYPKEVWYCTKEAMEPDDYKNVADTIWEETLGHEDLVTQNDSAGNFVEFSRKITPYIKRAEFSAEQEYRLVFEKSQWQNDQFDFKIDYRNNKNVLKPYLDVACENGWPIHEIIIGPGFNQKVVFESVRYFLNNANLTVPKLDNKTFLSRFDEYLGLCGEVPDEIQNWLKEERKKLENRENIYRSLCNLRNQIIVKFGKEGADKKEFVEKMKKIEFTKHGIILSCSRIPYIFEN